MNILIRADASSEIGTGHIMRDLVLARQFKNDHVAFAVQELAGNINHKISEAGYAMYTLASHDLEELVEVIEKLKIDMVVIDHYGIDAAYEKMLKERTGIILFVLDDTYEKHDCNILLNHNIYADAHRYDGLVPVGCELRCGEQYTLLRDEFTQAKQSKQVRSSKEIQTIFVAMGGTDVANLNPKIVEVLESFKAIDVHIVTTTANLHLEELKNIVQDKAWVTLHVNATQIAYLMAQSDLAIVTPSVTMNEVWFMRIPFIAIKVADNQRYMVDFLTSHHKNVIEHFDEQALYHVLSHAIESKYELVNFIDLTLDEKQLILDWRNHDEIRKWMYHQQPIALDEHLNYIASLKSRSDRLYFWVKEEGMGIGVIDFTSIDDQKRSAEIGLYARPGSSRVGRKLMTLIIEFGFHTLHLRVLYATVYCNNTKAFELYKKFGFIEIKRDDELIYMELKNENR